LGNDYPVSIQLVAPNRILISWIVHELTRGLSANEGVTPRNIGFTIIPNPVSDNLKLNFGDIAPEVLNIKILDVSGRELYLTKDYNREINIASYPTGVYLLQVNYKDGRNSVQRFVKAN